MSVWLLKMRKFVKIYALQKCVSVMTNVPQHNDAGF